MASLPASASSAAPKRLHVETQLGGLLLEPRPPQRRDVVGVEPIVHRPELPLRAGGARRDRRRPRLLVKRQRHVAPDEPDLVRVLLPQPRQRLLDARAERDTESRTTRRW